MKTMFARVCLLFGLTLSGAVPVSGATPLQWSVRMADSEIARRGDSLVWKQGGPAKWDYTVGLFTLSLLKLDGQVHNPDYVKFAENTIGSFFTTNGGIQGYKVAEYQLDAINPGKTVLALWQITHDERYQKAATLFNGPVSDYDDIAKQIRLVAAHTYDPVTGLFYHAWDESKEQPWAIKTTGTSSNFWGRAMGWYAMALVDVLDFFPTNHPARPEIIATFQKLCGEVVKYQDPQTGLWYQVVDQSGRKGNYLIPKSGL